MSASAHKSGQWLALLAAFCMPIWCCCLQAPRAAAASAKQADDGACREGHCSSSRSDSAPAAPRSSPSSPQPARDCSCAQTHFATAPASEVSLPAFDAGPVLPLVLLAWAFDDPFLTQPPLGAWAHNRHGPPCDPPRALLARHCTLLI